jgi:hypothetical protein
VLELLGLLLEVPFLGLEFGLPFLEGLLAALLVGDVVDERDPTRQRAGAVREVRHRDVETAQAVRGVDPLDAGELRQFVAGVELREHRIEVDHVVDAPADDLPVFAEYPSPHRVDVDDPVLHVEDDDAAVQFLDDVVPRQGQQRFEARTEPTEDLVHRDEFDELHAVEERDGDHADDEEAHREQHQVGQGAQARERGDRREPQGDAAHEHREAVLPIDVPRVEELPEEQGVSDGEEGVPAGDVQPDDGTPVVRELDEAAAGVEPRRDEDEPVSVVVSVRTSHGIGERARTARRGRVIHSSRPVYVTAKSVHDIARYAVVRSKTANQNSLPRSVVLETTSASDADQAAIATMVAPYQRTPARSRFAPREIGRRDCECDRERERERVRRVLVRHRPGVPRFPSPTDIGPARIENDTR